jgi:hypothetical protein
MWMDSRRRICINFEIKNIATMCMVLKDRKKYVVDNEANIVVKGIVTCGLGFDE